MIQIDLESSIKIAILSFLLTWPSTGGGIDHTVELTNFLSKAGYRVRHFHARYDPWGIGRIDGNSPLTTTSIAFDEASWNAATIRERFRSAVNAFDPDAVIIMDSWNFKPHLAQAVSDYPTFLRFQALECLCPLNNLRLIPIGPGQLEQCPSHQFATPDLCRQCLVERGHLSGSLHKAERALAGVVSAEYDDMLRSALWEAEGILVLNPITEAMLSPFAKRVHVVPWGMDKARFPWPIAVRSVGEKLNLLVRGYPEMLPKPNRLHSTGFGADSQIEPVYVKFLDVGLF